MHCNGSRRLNIFIVVYLMFVLLQYSNSQEQANNENVENDSQLGINGDLYDVFKKRLQKVFKELSNDPDETSNVNAVSSDEANANGQKRSPANTCLYEEYKRRLDKLNNDLALDAGKTLKRKITVAPEDNAEKRSTVRECLYEEYKKRMDKINNEFSLDGEKVFDRSGRGLQEVGSEEEKIPLPEQQQSQSHKQTQGITEAISKTPINDAIINVIMRRTLAEEPPKKEEVDKVNKNDLLKKDNTECNRQQDPVHVVDENLFRTQDFKKIHSPGQSKDIGNLKSYIVSNNYGDYNDQIEAKEDNSDTTTTDNETNQKKLANIIRRNTLGNNLLNTHASTYADNILTYGMDGGGASYPAVLTKALESSLNPLINSTPQNLLASVAEKMNMTTLDLAKKLASITTPVTADSIKSDPKLSQVLKKYLETTVHGRLQKQPDTIPPADRAFYDNAPIVVQDIQQCDSPTSTDVESNAHISSVLEKVLNKLEHIQADKDKTDKTNETAADTCQPEGAPCDIIGSWNSYMMGLRFDILTGKPSDRHLSNAEKNNKLLSIEAAECVPPKHHDMMTPGWKFMGSAIKQIGGPFYIYSQNRGENTLATFTGFCRTCGGIDTIFGSWTFLCPSKDCQDVMTSIDNKRDIFRRYSMDAKRKQRHKELLFAGSKLPKSKCDG